MLALYLNEIYYGNLAYGAEAASQALFGKHVSELTLGESALLAGLPQAPANLDPLNPDPEVQATSRRAGGRCSTGWCGRGYITRRQRDAALTRGAGL